jgi:hypothetical protein
MFVLSIGLVRTVLRTLQNGGNLKFGDLFHPQHQLLPRDAFVGAEVRDGIASHQDRLKMPRRDVELPAEVAATFLRKLGSTEAAGGVLEDLGDDDTLIFEGQPDAVKLLHLQAVGPIARRRGKDKEHRRVPAKRFCGFSGCYHFRPHFPASQRSPNGGIITETFAACQPYLRDFIGIKDNA